MKKIILILVLVGAAGFLGLSVVRAQQRKNPAPYEFAIVRWNDPDQLIYHYPDRRVELVQYLKTGKTIPKDAANEEFCLTEAANFLAKTGWEFVSLDGPRMVFRRPTN